jgi:hypothetical protein
MNEDLPRPDIVLTVLVHTREITAARSWGLVIGSGLTPEDAVDAMCQQALAQGEKIFDALWEPKSPWRDKIAKKAIQKGIHVTLEGAMSIGSARLAYGDTDKGPGWVSYGTILTDSTGDGTNWLQPQMPPEGNK